MYVIKLLTKLLTRAYQKEAQRYAAKADKLAKRRIDLDAENLNIQEEIDQLHAERIHNCRESGELVGHITAAKRAEAQYVAKASQVESFFKVD